MIDLTQYPKDPTAFGALLNCITSVLDTDRRLPDWPCRRRSANADVCQYSHAIEGTFGPVLQALVDLHGDEAVSLVVLEPSPRYYRYNYGSYPAFSLSSQDLAEAYWEAVAHEPQGDPTGAVIYTADVVALTGSSKTWAVWAERSWDIAVVFSEHRNGPWLSRGVPFVPAEVALRDFTEPDFKTPLSPEQRQAFLRNFRQWSPP